MLPFPSLIIRDWTQLMCMTYLSISPADLIDGCCMVPRNNSDCFHIKFELTAFGNEDCIFFEVRTICLNMTKTG